MREVAERLRPVTVSAVGLQVKLAGLHVSDDEIVPMFLSFVKDLGQPAPAAAGDAGAPSTDAPAEQGAQ